ncbi:MAG: ADP-ribosylglycohydrolase family protein [Spirochaetota bacterium]
MLAKELNSSGAGALNLELMQCKGEGKDTRGCEEKLNSVLSMEPDNPQREIRAEEIYRELAALPLRRDFLFLEPSDLDGIMDLRPDSGKGLKPGLSYLNENMIYDRVYGAWLGRCAGCLLGVPVEDWPRDRINGFLRETGNYPVKNYMSSNVPEEIKQKYGVVDVIKAYAGNRSNWINNVNCMPEDDDTNYTILGLKILKDYGPDFTPLDVAETWLAGIPILHTYTAERVAYRNLVDLKMPPVSALYRNPYREWIGAQIRADFFGYITPGNPELGACMAWRDACISHVKNGIYGEMFVAAMLSAAAVTGDINEIIHTGLSQIPEKSRLSAEIRAVIEWKRAGTPWEQALDKLHLKYDEKNSYDWCLVMTNAAVVCLGLIYGGLDFEKSVGLAVHSGFDTDCNAATIGSIVGMVLGAKALPQKWAAPLNDRIKSCVAGFGDVRISEMARRTVNIIKQIRNRD